MLSDGTAYTSYMGGPHVAGPAEYTDGPGPTGNGLAGSPGEIVRVGKNGQTLSQTPAATKAGENPNLCHNNPQFGSSRRAPTRTASRYART